MDPSFRADLERRLIAAVRDNTLPVPAYPPVWTRLNQLLNAPGSTMGAIANVVAGDAALAATVLRHARSAAVRGGSQLSLSAACTRLGVDAIRRILVAALLGARVLGPGRLLQVRRRIWRDGLAVAELCQSLAEARGLSPQVAYLVGLLHDFGSAIALGVVEELLGDAGVVPTDEADWLALVRSYSAELGLATAAKWGLPDLLGEAIGAFHYGGDRDPVASLLVGLVRIGRAVVALIDQVPEIDATALQAVPALRAPSETRLVATFWQRLPGILHTYEADDARPAPPVAAAVAVSQPDTTLVGQVRPLQLLAQRRSRREHQPWLVTAMSSGALRLEVDEPLTPHTVVELEIDLGESTPLRLWLNLDACSPTGARWSAEGRPMALAGESALRWRALWDRAASGQAESPARRAGGTAARAAGVDRHSPGAG